MAVDTTVFSGQFEHRSELLETLEGNEMKGNFDKCMGWLLVHEGGYVDHKHDPGGATNLGVTHKVWAKWIGKESVSKDEIKALTVKQVMPLYKAKYWDRVKGDELPSGVDWAVFDIAVNSGTGRAGKFLQEAVGAKPDGVIGPMTMALVKKSDPKTVVKKIYKRRQAFYESLSNFKHFGKGWTRRNDETYHQALDLL